MRSLFAEAPCERLDLDAYLEDFDRHFWNSGATGFWKLERRQTFREAGVESWEAFQCGEWQEALSLIADQDNHFERYFERITQSGFALHRVRVIEEPLSPYLQWELHLLRLKEKHGERTRVLPKENLPGGEKSGLLPEVVVLGELVMYEIIYDDDGNLAGGIKFTDASVIEKCREFIQGLHAAGEQLRSFFGRRVAPLPPPAIDSAS
ncbi:DUF6879 family protein [Streptomyces sp. NPDC057705]|uniref:DUF6879 family protein n=1 Tax=Streptomyces sp. NPDC057705 TaxID=3346222 RepID=UPI0036B9BC76